VREGGGSPKSNIGKEVNTGNEIYEEKTTTQSLKEKKRGGNLNPGAGQGAKKNRD